MKSNFVATAMTRLVAAGLSAAVLLALIILPGGAQGAYSGTLRLACKQAARHGRQGSGAQDGSACAAADLSLHS